MPAKPYVYFDGAGWCIQWYVGLVRRFVRAGSYGYALRLAGAVRRWQTGREA